MVALFLVLLANPATYVGDTVSVGATTRAVRDAEPRGYRVHWISWQSGFRDSQLRIRDRIIGVDGKRYPDKVFDKHLGVGDNREVTYWAQHGKKDGDTVELLVLRDEKELRVTGKLRAVRSWRTAKGERLLSPHGPAVLKRDGFQRAWSDWHARFVKASAHYLAVGWDQSGFNSRKLLADHDQQRPRIEHLLKQHAGPFASAVDRDWQAVRICLAGDLRKLSATDLEYRSFAERRIAQVRKAGAAARATFLEKRRAEFTEAFPAPDPAKDDPAAFVGKLVDLPWVYERSLVKDLGRSFFCVGARTSGYYFVETSSVEMNKFWGAWARYRSKVDPNLRESYRFVGVVEDAPRMITVQRNPAAGLVVRVVAVSAGDGAFFVDLSGAEPRFAGEADLKQKSTTRITAQSPPGDVVTAMIETIKFGDRERWQRLFGDWRTVQAYSQRPIFTPKYVASSFAFDRAWARSRKNLLGPVYAADVKRVGPVQRIWTRVPTSPTPTIDRVVVEISVVGKFADEYRTYAHYSVTRFWVLERLDEGPWKITEVKSL